MRTLAEVPAAAVRQGGVFTVAQAVAEGWTARQIRRRRATGKWAYVAGKALAAVPAPGVPWTDFQLAVAAQLTVPGCTTSHWTAAALHGFPLTGERRRVAHVISHRRHDGCRDIRIHRLRLDEGEVACRPSGLRITDPQRTALDLLAALPTPGALDLWAWVSSRKILDAATLESALLRRKNWHGSDGLATLARLTRDGAVSGAEIMLHDLLRRAGITGWTAGATITDARGVIGVVDLFFPAARVIVEVDGFTAHSSRTTFIGDRRRQNRLVASGYVVLRFTWVDLNERPGDVIAEIRAALAK